MTVRVRWSLAVLAALLLGLLVVFLVARRVPPTSPPEQRFDRSSAQRPRRIADR